MHVKLCDLQDDLSLFEKLWRGGYSEGEVLDPMGNSGYGIIGYMSVLYATYLICIKPYISKDTIVLEIGPGRGCWTKTFLSAKEVWCLDAVSKERNKFDEYLGYPKNVKYFKVSDFGCDMLPENYFDYLFSFGCFCHISFDGISEYMENLYPKMKEGSHCFIMVADYDKFNKAIDNIRSLSIERAFVGGKHILTRMLWKLVGGTKILKHLNKEEDNLPRPGRWYHAGCERTCAMLEKYGYKIIDPDIGVNHRDPIIHFIKG